MSFTILFHFLCAQHVSDLNIYVKKCMVQQSKIQGGVYDKEAFIRIFKIIRYIYLDLYLDF